jgi:hypothetical protein
MDELSAGQSAESPGILVITGGAAPALQAVLLRLGGFQGPGRSPRPWPASRWCRSAPARAPATRSAR